MGRGPDPHRPTGVIGKLFISAFLAVFLAAGLGFGGFLIHEAIDLSATYGWTPVECTILTSEVDRSGDNYVFRVEYEYPSNGGSFTASTYSLGDSGRAAYEDVQALVERYPVESTAPCYVNPQVASEAVLDHASLWILAFLPLPLLFVFVGGGGIIFTWFGRSKDARAADSEKPSRRSISSRASKGRVASRAFFSLFFLVGMGFFWWTTIHPTYKIIQARGWEATPCEVISSRVRSHDSDDGTTYSVDILYEYEFDGQIRRSNRYSFVGFSSGGYDGKRKIVREHPSGKKTICHVNPRRPREAVLQRGFTVVMWIGAIPFIFVVIGGVGLFYSLRGRVASRSKTRAAWKPRTEERTLTTVEGVDQKVYRAAKGPIILRGKTSPLTMLIGSIVICLFWNGIISVFLYQLFEGSWGAESWFLAVFLTPFVLIGLGLAGAVLYCALALFNPRPQLVVSTDSAPPGGTVVLAWEFERGAERISRLRIFLEGREEATYTRGTRSYTDRQCFAVVDVVDSEEPATIERGRATVTIPERTMHSFETRHNRIVWALKVHGDIRRWPDVHSEFGFVVLPARVIQTVKESCR